MSFCSLAIHIYIVKLCVVLANLRICHVLGDMFQIETGEAFALGPKLLWNIKHPDATHAMSTDEATVIVQIAEFTTSLPPGRPPPCPQTPMCVT